MPRAARELFHPTLRTQWLGHQLREIRKRSGRSLADAALYLNYDPSYLARCERAEWPFRQDHLNMLLDFYQVNDGDLRARLVADLAASWQLNVFDMGGSIHTNRSVSLTWLEGRAETIYLYAVLVVPGLLQTRDYAHATMRFYGDPDEGAERWVDLRIGRQQILDRSAPVRLSAVIDETALRYPIAEPATMRAQLTHLMTMNRRPGVEVRVLPAGTRRPDGAGGPFAVIRLPKPYPSVAYLENLAGSFYLEGPRSRKFVDAYDQIRRSALPAGESAKRITQIIEEEWS
ncbi:helix-turn-helix domain-containing protein [Micromonospora sp. NBC_01813]|uniref:helix-turn-helix domain-containing protein n=1 Tax=Micromonospora sp. NBC_01813 TaxID=2975988 RepID=UPI002DD9D916|nr:helix-turn-helix transcriptional regulator [Micromonospora sp. NBC_01813]WSA12375.1 helix-turn-helix domain-containing protein [Micromonospora sp. NBC_01813]